MSEERKVYGDSTRIDFQSCPSGLRFDDPGYVAPTVDEIRSAIKQAGLTGSEAGQLLGVDSRTIRRWTGGEREIPYAAWRLLLIETGQAPGA